MSNQFIAVIGPDGAGKTKRAEWLAENLPGVYIYPIIKNNLKEGEIARLHLPKMMSSEKNK
ncbi:MAG: hypothetical protein ABH828_04405 [archaeon]